MDDYYALIMAGGGGTRLWPMSRKDKPKQLLPLIDDHSMFKMTVDRLAPLFSPEQIYVVTGPHYVDDMRAEVPEIPEKNFIIEPSGRNSGPAAGLAMSVIHQHDPNATVAMLSVDHYIAKKDTFREVLQAAYQIAQDGYIVTLGISPSFPSTGFGYIRQGKKLTKVDGFTCYETRGFTEKPSMLKATEFLVSGEYSWNSGMFIWKAARATEEFERQQPLMSGLLKRLQFLMGTPEFDNTLEQVWEQFPKISIDFAIMEGAQQMAVIPIDLGWSDVGSWTSLFEVLNQDEDGNAFKGQSPDRVILDTKNTLVYSDRLVVTIGVEDLIIVDTPDALLICHKERSQDVREVVKHLNLLEKTDYL
ncbi:MAG: mannose-1-phosphate guanylyltransferase [Chitinophagaceae bacterium]|nr:mannose-1-phosphate guanylyltransferase [Anaerolineae bacterium]